MKPEDQQPASAGYEPGGQVAHSPEQYVYVTRPHEPMQPVLSDEQRKRHEDSKKKYPDLNLSEGELIISAVDRHIIGLLQIWSIVVVIVAIIFLAVFALGDMARDDAGRRAIAPMVLAVPALLLSVLTLLFGFIASSIYNANKFFLTNESVIQLIQVGLFSKREQTVSLANIEDASYNQHGIVPHLFNYGLIRLSTEGDETTYRFNYASNPKKQVAILNNAVEAFKNGRPVTGNDD